METEAASGDNTAVSQQDVTSSEPSSAQKEAPPATDDREAIPAPVEGNGEGKSDGAVVGVEEKRDQEESMETDDSAMKKPAEAVKGDATGAVKGEATGSASEHGETTEESDKD